MVANGPVVRAKLPIIGKTWFATHHDAVMALLKDNDNFAIDRRNAGKKNFLPIPFVPKAFKLLMENMLSYDDPDHRRLRKVADKSFRTANIEAMRPSIEVIANQLLDEMISTGNQDLVSGLFSKLPNLVICELLGLDTEQQNQLSKQLAAFDEVTNLSGLFKVSPAIKKMTRFFIEEFEARRRHPKPGLISEFIKIADTDEDRLSENELVAMVFILFIAGNETTKNALSSAVPCLLDHPEQLRALKNDWSLAPIATEELIRFNSPVMLTKPRFARHDLEFYGHPLKKGQSIMAMLAAANLDPSYFDDPLQFNLHREKVRHVGFGNGMHLCLGIQLARVEIQVTLETLFKRYPDLSLAVPYRSLVWAKRIGARGLKSLPVNFSPA